MKVYLLFLLLIFPLMVPAAERPGTPPVARAAKPADAKEAMVRKSKWVFNLLPKAFQRDPFLDMTVFTEMTDAGRALTPPTEERPVYFVATSPGYRAEGPSIREHPPEPDELVAAMEKSLAVAGYLPAAPEHPATLLLVLHWGSHNRLEITVAEIDPDLVLRNLFARARLVGGVEFSETLQKAYEDDLRASSIGLPFPRQIDILRNRSSNLGFVIDQCHHDVYFVVASAYDYAAMARSEPTLLWRTTMTVVTQGASMKQTLPALIASGTGFFGHEMSEAVAIQTRGLPEGRVEIGEPEVLGTVENDGAAQNDSARAPTGAARPSRRP